MSIGHQLRAEAATQPETTAPGGSNGHGPASRPGGEAAAAVDASIEALAKRVDIVTWDDLPEAMARIRPGVRRIVHCAGCMDYANDRMLQEVNVDLTRWLAGLACDHRVERFVHVSTAFASGFSDEPIPEALHEGPRDDPSGYTRTKREAEWLVAESGQPWLVVRPAIVIGHSQTGLYQGRPHGIYQLWTAAHRLLSRHRRRVRHAVAPAKPANLVHWDAVVAGCRLAEDHLDDDAVVHLVSRQETLPTARQLVHFWLERFGLLDQVDWYESIAALPMEQLDRLNQRFYGFVRDNLEIISRQWRFDRSTLTRLESSLGVTLPDATILSTARCYHAFMAAFEDAGASLMPRSNSTAEAAS